MTAQEKREEKNEKTESAASKYQKHIMQREIHCRCPRQRDPVNVSLCVSVSSSDSCIDGSATVLQKKLYSCVVGLKNK